MREVVSASDQAGGCRAVVVVAKAGVCVVGAFGGLGGVSGVEEEKGKDGDRP